MDQNKSIPEERYKLEIFVKAKNLKDMDTFSKSDPFCRLIHTIQGEKEKCEGDTEFLKNNLNPCWEKSFVIDYIFELNQKLVFQVWDKNQSAGSEDYLMGEVETTVADIVGAKDMKQEFELKDKKGKGVGTLIVNIDKQPEDNQFLQLSWIGKDLMNTDGFFGKSDPFLKFYKRVGEDWLPVHKTEMIKDNLNPEWKPFQISFKRLCGNKQEEKFKVECWDVHEKGTNNQYMGHFETSIHEIINENKSEFNLEYQANKSGGKIILKEKKVIKRPTFMDFLKDGEQINLIIGVDYTAQNGNPNFPDSLHAFKTQNGNQYETAIKACAQILLNYDYDKKVAMYGFGAVPHLPNYNVNETEQCFPLTGDFQKPEVYGLEGLVNLYKQTLPNLQFSGPGCLGEILNYSKQIAEFNAKKKIYTVLLILTCGQIHDLHQTTEIIAQCANVPISVILVGVGDFDFKKLEFLDQDQKQLQKEVLTRNVVQFVPFAPFSHSLPILQRELLAELPHQLTNYKSLLGLVPSK
ncbi:unnamed protein product [Paramecium primaurelia]|uniref:C2 domain-containing protein n=1 Tax=Paramecium primaurelia TaxID=5886 RepID=A0A8S1P8Z6_PARPR|nr:unnamed protein product [Paramecium primaurelia]